MNDDTTTDVAQLKRRARLISREAGIPHRQALDILARKAGHGHWGPYLAALQARVPAPGWTRDGSFSAYPPLIDAILSRHDVTSLALNADGSAWVAVHGHGRPVWQPLDPSEVDHRDAISSFMRSSPASMRNPSGLTFLVTDGETGRLDRLTARYSYSRGQAVELTILKGMVPGDPRITPIDEWNMDKPIWHVHLFSMRSGAAVRNACDQVVGDLRDTARLVTFGVGVEAQRHPNRVEAYGRLHDTDSAIDYAMRVGGDAFVAVADTPEHAAAALAMASTNHGPFAILIDADLPDAIDHLTRLGHAGNVSPSRNVRKGLAETISLLPERCTLHG